MVVEDEGDQPPDDASHIEDAPEEGNIGALPVRRRVGGHDGPLAGPEEPGADPEYGSGDDGEGLVVVVVVVEERASVEDVGGAASGEGEAWPEDVVDSTTEDAKDSEGRVESGVGVIGSRVVDLTAAAHTGESVEHAGTAKADKPDEAHLNQRGIVTKQ